MCAKSHGVSGHWWDRGPCALAPRALTHHNSLRRSNRNFITQKSDREMANFFHFTPRFKKFCVSVTALTLYAFLEEWTTIAAVTEVTVFPLLFYSHPFSAINRGLIFEKKQGRTKSWFIFFYFFQNQEDFRIVNKFLHRKTYFVWMTEDTRLTEWRNVYTIAIHCGRHVWIRKAILFERNPFFLSQDCFFALSREFSLVDQSHSTVPKTAYV